MYVKQTVDFDLSRAFWHFFISKYAISKFSFTTILDGFEKQFLFVAKILGLYRL